MSHHRLVLYVTGDTPQSQQAIANLRRICDELLGGTAECIVVDVLDHPDVAETERILATPTLVKELPAPPRRVTGDLSDAAKVLLGLAVQPGSPSINARANQ